MHSNMELHLDEQQHTCSNDVTIINRLLLGMGSMGRMLNTVVLWVKH